MNGPSIDDLTRHLAECPPEFLMEPGPEGIHTDAVVYDTLLLLGHPTVPRLAPPERAIARITLILCWLLYHPWFREFRPGRQAEILLLELPHELGQVVDAEKLVTDPDRREELARLTLYRLNATPLGETPEHAADRLQAISSVERARVLRETQAQFEHARRIREAMASERAREAASRYTGE